MLSIAVGWKVEEQKETTIAQDYDTTVFLLFLGTISFENI